MDSYKGMWYNSKLIDKNYSGLTESDITIRWDFDIHSVPFIRNTVILLTVLFLNFVRNLISPVAYLFLDFSRTDYVS